MPSERRQRTRQKLIQAAHQTVARDGFHGASVDAIASRAGYSIGALYANFRGKDELFLAVFDEHVAWFETQLERSREQEPRAGFVRAIDQISRHPEQFMVFIEFWAYAMRKPGTRRQLAARLAVLRERVNEAVGGDERMGLLALATLRGLVLEKLADPEVVPDDLLLDLGASFPGGA